MRGSGNGKNGPIHMVSAIATDCGLVLGQQKVDGKSNEIRAIPELLDALLIKGYLVSIDAMGCKSEIAAKVLRRRPTTCWPSKATSPAFRARCRSVSASPSGRRYSSPGATPSARSYPAGASYRRASGSRPTRAKSISNAGRAAACSEWSSLCARLATRNRPPKRRYYISSPVLSAEAFASGVRAHWGIENGVHWMLDVNFHEDAATVRKDHAADNLPRLKRIVLNLLKVETATASFGKISLAEKRKLARWDDGYRMPMFGITPVHDE